MSSYNEYISTLVSLGLSPSQAKVYLALVKSDNLPAGTINKISGVDRPDVYRALNQLQEAGLVQKIISNPVRFQAIPPEECMTVLLQRRIKRTHQLQKNALKFTQALKSKHTNNEYNERGGFTLIHGRDAAYAKSEKMFGSAQQSICLLAFTKRLLAFLLQCEDCLENALKRKVDCRIIIAKEVKDVYAPLEDLRKYSNFSLKLISERPKTSFSLWDQKELLLTTSVVDTSIPAPLLWSNNRAMINLCSDYFEHLWLEAKNV